MTVALEGEMVRENVLRERARRDLEGTLARYGYHLTEEELRPVRNLRRQSAGMSAEELAGTLAAGFAGRDGDPPARPAAPGWHGTGPARPARPGR